MAHWHQRLYYMKTNKKSDPSEHWTWNLTHVDLFCFASPFLRWTALLPRVRAKKSNYEMRFTKIAIPLSYPPHGKWNKDTFFYHKTFLHSLQLWRNVAGPVCPNVQWRVSTVTESSPYCLKRTNICHIKSTFYVSFIVILICKTCLRGTKQSDIGQL